MYLRYDTITKELTVQAGEFKDNVQGLTKCRHFDLKLSTIITKEDAGNSYFYQYHLDNEESVNVPFKLQKYDNTLSDNENLLNNGFGFLHYDENSKTWNSFSNRKLRKERVTYIHAATGVVVNYVLTHPYSEYNTEFLNNLIVNTHCNINNNYDISTCHSIEKLEGLIKEEYEKLNPEIYIKPEFIKELGVCEHCGHLLKDSVYCTACGERNEYYHFSFRSEHVKKAICVIKPNSIVSPVTINLVIIRGRDIFEAHLELHPTKEELKENDINDMIDNLLKDYRLQDVNKSTYLDLELDSE